MRALIRFGKEPRLRFISHLDLQRFFQRALNRTGLPIAYTQGFNPHPILSFGSALALGYTSEYEVLDIKLAVPMGRKRTEDAMRSALPVDLPVLETKLVDDRHPAPMAQVCATEYRITFPENTSFPIAEAVNAFMAKESIAAIRKTKSGEREIDVRPLALDLRVEDNILYSRLILNEKDALKPDLLLNVLGNLAEAEVPETKIHRLSLFGKKENGEMCPLMEL